MIRHGPSQNAHSIFQRLLNKARELDEDFNLLLARYCTERLLFRISESPLAAHFVLKGATLLLVWQGHSTRVTRDLDLLDTSGLDAASLKRRLEQCCTMSLQEDDGVQFPIESLNVRPLVGTQLTSGFRVQLHAELHTARVPLHVDIGQGDAVFPAPEYISYPLLLKAPPLHFQAYTPYSFVAEKFEAMVRLGIANSRMKDFHDIALVARSHAFDEELLMHAMRLTFRHRGTVIPSTRPVAFTSAFTHDAQKLSQWKGFIKRARPEATFGDLTDVVREVEALIMPVLMKMQASGGE